MLEESIDNLAEAMRENTAALLKQTHPAVVLNPSDTVEPEKKASSKKKRVKAKAAEKTDANPQGSAITGVLGEAPADQVLDAESVQKHLRAAASQLTDTSQLFELIQKHGGNQFSDLDASVHPELVKEADALVKAQAKK